MYRCEVCCHNVTANQPQLLIRQMKPAPLEHQVQRELRVCSKCQESHQKGIPLAFLRRKAEELAAAVKITERMPVGAAHCNTPISKVALSLGRPANSIKPPPLATRKRKTLDDVLENLEEKGKRPRSNLRNKKETPRPEQQQLSRGRRPASSPVSGVQAGDAVQQDAGHSDQRHSHKGGKSGKGSSPGSAPKG